MALLLFSLGLELSFRDLQPVRRVALIGGPIQIVVTSAVGALAAAKGLGMPAREAIWFGAMISVSSTAVVLKMLSAAGVTQTLASRVMIGLLVIQDLAVVPMLVVLPQLGAADHLLASLAKAIGIATALLAAIVILGTWLLPKLLRLVLAWGSRELFLVSVVAIGVGVGYATQLVGLSFALGAFVAGLVLSESEFSHQALSEVVPIRDIFGLLFFVSVGMLLDPAYAFSHAGQIAAVVLLTFLGKSVILGGHCQGVRLCQYGSMDRWTGPFSDRRVFLRPGAHRDDIRDVYPSPHTTWHSPVRCSRWPFRHSQRRWRCPWVGMAHLAEAHPSTGTSRVSRTIPCTGT